MICCPGGKEADSYEIPETVTTVSNSAFAVCESLTSVRLPDSVTSIGEYAFYRCVSLENMTMPAGIVSIGKAAFLRCNSLADVYYGGSESDWAAIEIGEKNDPLLAAAIHYNSEDTGNSGDTLMVRRGNTMYFNYTLEGGNADFSISAGLSTDQVPVGDWDANGTDTLAMRRDGNYYFISNSIANPDSDVDEFTFGRASDEVYAGKRK